MRTRRLRHMPCCSRWRLVHGAPAAHARRRRRPSHAPAAATAAAARRDRAAPWFRRPATSSGPTTCWHHVLAGQGHVARRSRCRPDGKITLPLLNDVQAAGLTPDQLRDRVTEESQAYIEDPNVTIIVRQINSRKVFVTGEVAKPGPYPLMRSDNGPADDRDRRGHAANTPMRRTSSSCESRRAARSTYPFNYRDVVRRRNLKQNIELRPGDTIVVP